MPPLPDSSDLDVALAAYLQADATLIGLLPDGVHIDEAKTGSKRFVLISVVDAFDRPVFVQRGFEVVRYLVKAVGLSTVITGPQMKSAAAQIDALLENLQLTVTGYPGPASLYRIRRIRELEVDEIDASIRWYHQGGHYLMHAPHSS
jgi:hypothetical protein